MTTMPPPSSDLNLALSESGTKVAATDSDAAAARLKRKSDVLMDFEGIDAAAGADERDSLTKTTAASPGTSKTKRRRDK